MEQTISGQYLDINDAEDAESSIAQAPVKKLSGASTRT